MKTKLIDTEIKNLKPTEKRQQLADGGGLVLYVMPNGSKLWRYRYRYGEKANVISLGEYPTVSLKEARAARDDVRALLDAGIDPSQAKRENKAVKSQAIKNTFESVARAWWDHWRIGRTDSHVNRTLKRLELNVFPLLGNKPIEQITTQLLVTMVKDVASRGALDLAKRAHHTSGQIFRYAVQHGLCESNPSASIKPSEIIPRHTPKNQTRIDLSELPQLLRDIDKYKGLELTKIAIKLLALTFVRTKELVEAEWSEIDFNAGLWRIPAARMKMNTPHVVPLSRQTLELLSQLHKITGNSDYLFPNQGSKRGLSMSNNTILFALYRMGYRGRMTGHGFRGVASTALNEQQYPQKHIELQLAHLTGNATQRAYDHAQHMPERIKMVQDWADFLDEQRDKGKVIKMVRA